MIVIPRSAGDVGISTYVFFVTAEQKSQDRSVRKTIYKDLSTSISFSNIDIIF